MVKFSNATNGQPQVIIICTAAFLYARHSLLLISNKFCNGGGGSSAVMLLNPTGGVGGCGGAVHYRTVPHCSPHCPFDFLGPKQHSPIGSMPFHWAQKSLHFPGPKPPPTCPHNGCCPQQKHYTRGRINHRCINSYYLLWSPNNMAG